MTRRQRRTVLVLFLLVGVGATAALGLKAFQENLLYFISPSEIAAGNAPQERSFRLGGMVEEGSLAREGESLEVSFRVTDFAESVPVVYNGILPDLFREGQGVVANGHLSSEGTFVAEEVLAKHDENYMPPEVAEALEKGQATADARKAGATQ